MAECGKAAEFVGTLVLSTANMAGQSGRKHVGPFCAGHKTTPQGWHRQFVADRPATPDEKCTVVEDLMSN